MLSAELRASLGKNRVTSIAARNLMLTKISGRGYHYVMDGVLY
jgi:hypothetical protein